MTAEDRLRAAEATIRKINADNQALRKRIHSLEEHFSKDQRIIKALQATIERLEDELKTLKRSSRRKTKTSSEDTDADS